MIRKTLTLSLTFLLLIVAVFAQTKYVNVSTLNLRSSPTTSSNNVLLQLKQGTAVEIISVDGDWAEVECNGITGYVFNKYLTTNSPGTQVTYQKQSGNMVLICNSSAAYAYHRYQCRGLSRCTHEISKVTEQSAINQKYRPCKICYR